MIAFAGNVPRRRRRTHQRINLGTGVLSLPYHHPFNVSHRSVAARLTYRGLRCAVPVRAALASDAHTLGSIR